MNRSELIDALALRQKIPVKLAEEIVTTIFGMMSDAMIAGDRIEIRGIGSFVIKTYEPYMGRNPKTGEPIEVLPKKLPFFKVGKELKELVSGQE